MKHSSKTAILAVGAVLGSGADVSAQHLWRDATLETLGVETGEWTNRVEVADLDGDGDLDIVFANGGAYNEAGEPERNRVFINDGAGGMTEATSKILGERPDLSRVIKARDLNGDGVVDLLVGTVYQTQSRLYFGRGAGVFEEVTETHLPAALDSIGDVEAGDVDGDGDLDLVWSDWGAADPLSSEDEGGRVKLYLNDGEGRFEDATERMPERLIRMSWDLEVHDIDNDADLDILVACKMCQGNALYINDGAGGFTDASDRLPVFIGRDGFEPMDMNRDGVPEHNNYDFEAMDLDGDGFLDLITVNDGELVPGGGIFHRRETVLLNDGEGGFVDATEALLGPESNLGFDDNAAAFLDVDSDGDADVLIGSLDGPDRLLINDGSGVLTLHDRIDGVEAVEGALETAGTLGIALGDLNGDARLDLVQGQGELAEAEFVHLATEVMPMDSQAPRISGVSLSDTMLRVRVHDLKSNPMPHDLGEVALVSGDSSTPLRSAGGYLWQLERPDSIAGAEVCATDRAGNRACVPAEQVEATPGGRGKGDTAEGGASASGGEAADGGGCATGGAPAGAPTGSLALLGLVVLGLRRRG